MIVSETVGMISSRACGHVVPRSIWVSRMARVGMNARAHREVRWRAYSQRPGRPDEKLVKVHPKSFVDLSDHSKGKLNILGKPKCHSCGVELQRNDPSKPGYFTKQVDGPQAGQAPTKEVDKKYNTIWKSLPEETQQELLNDGASENFATPKGFVPYSHQYGHEAKPKKFASEIELGGELNKRVNCLRCHQALHFNVYDTSQHETVSVSDLLRDIPPGANVVYVLSARDFPLGINSEVFKQFDAQKVHFVINKIDHFYDRVNQVEKLALKYFGQVLHKMYGADPRNVHVVSAKLMWGSKGLLNKIPRGDVYFLGEVNTGKSSLIKSLLYSDNIKLSKSGNFGPGVSHLPSFTRDKIVYPLTTRGTKIIDIPGFMDSNSTIHRHLSAADLKFFNQKPVFLNPLAVRKGKFMHSKINKIGSYNGERVMTIGGFFFLRPPAGSVVRFRVAMQGGMNVFSDIRRAIKRFRDEREDALRSLYTLKQEAYAEMDHYVIPPFLGSVDLVIGGVGFITISPTSSKVQVAKNKMYEVWVPKGVRVCVRETMVSYVYMSKSKYDAKGKLLAKSEIAEKGVTHLKDVPDNKPVVSRLFPVPPDTTEAVEVFADEFYKPTGPLSYKDIELIDPDTDTQDEYPNFYWEERI